jgi:hypothetical protein
MNERWRVRDSKWVVDLMGHKNVIKFTTTYFSICTETVMDCTKWRLGRLWESFETASCCTSLN